MAFRRDVAFMHEVEPNLMHLNGEEFGRVVALIDAAMPTIIQAHGGVEWESGAADLYRARLKDAETLAHGLREALAIASTALIRYAEQLTVAAARYRGPRLPTPTTTARPCRSRAARGSGSCLRSVQSRSRSCRIAAAGGCIGWVGRRLRGNCRLMSLAALQRALTETVVPPMRPLPAAVADLLVRLAAPPRLAAHLRAVHDVAWQLTDDISAAYPGLGFDRESVLFGAATHDIGKTLYLEELSRPGSRHEQAGYELLLAHGFDERRARFARDHAVWNTPDLSVEDLLVSVAGKIWKAKRVQDLEGRIVERLCATNGETTWRAFMTIDDIVNRIAHGADDRLAFQARHPIESPSQ